MKEYVLRTNETYEKPVQPALGQPLLQFFLVVAFLCYAHTRCLCVSISISSCRADRTTQQLAIQLRATLVHMQQSSSGRQPSCVRVTVLRYSLYIYIYFCFILSIIYLSDQRQMKLVYYIFHEHLW